MYHVHVHSCVFGRNLQIEYDRLKQVQDDDVAPPAAPASMALDSSVELEAESREAEMLAEAKLLRQHKGRLETRMQILEDHNRQLEAQLMRLRQLLDQVSDTWTRS